MDFNEYQMKTATTAIYPKNFFPGDGVLGVLYCALGLTNEAGEVAGKVKKVLRDHGGVFSEERRREIGAEIGDVLWYCSQLALELQLSLGEIAEMNLAKLEDRKARGKLQGNGDAR
jgi:NTP pyrophosphatase (non-canonical NTP hydrolase)